MKCPICEYEKCDELVIDLLICNECSHIFKKVPIIHDHMKVDDLHLLDDPIGGMRCVMEELGDTKVFTFKFPSMMFYTFALHPNNFYNSKYNHYFNQMSLMIFLKRCGLIATDQINTWDGQISITTIRAKRED